MQDGTNPLSGWRASVPEGQRLELGTEQFEGLETLGLCQVRGENGYVLIILIFKFVPPPFTVVENRPRRQCQVHTQCLCCVEAEIVRMGAEQSFAIG